MTMWQELQPDDPGRVGPYRLRGILGAGGMGRVFLGAAPDGQPVAVKVIRAELAADPEFRARFRREVTVARKVSSRFTVPLLDADVDGPVPWLATAYVSGPSLADAVTEHGPLPVRSVLELAAGLAAGLSAIHAAGVVHRDLKPSNVLLAHDGPRVIDFGISVAAETSPLTRTGLLIGSPGYMSPEQVEGREVGSPSDVFSLGAVLAFAATGEAPFGSGSAPTLAYRAVYRQVNLDSVPTEVRGLIQRCLAKDPGQRPTARDLEFAAGAAAVRPTEAWLPEAVTRTFLELPDSPRTMTSARLSPAAAPSARAGRHEGPRRRRRARPLVIAVMVAGLLAASAAGGVALATSSHQNSGLRSDQAVSGPMTSPATAGPVRPTQSMSAAPATVSSAPASAPATVSSAPASTPASGAPTATASAASPTATPTMSSSPVPSASPSASTAPAPGGPPAPSGSAAPTPAASLLNRMACRCVPSK
jgi:eukaryotic-like serine/threonine-protein kinase